MGSKKSKHEPTQMHTCIYCTHTSIPRTEVRRLPTPSVEARSPAQASTLRLLPSLCTKSRRAVACCARAHVSCGTDGVRELFQTGAACTSEVKALIEPVERTRSLNSGFWLRQLYTRLCSTGEERIFCPDPAGSRSKDEESCFWCLRAFIAQKDLPVSAGNIAK